MVWHYKERFCIQCFFLIRKKGKIKLFLTWPLILINMFENCGADKVYRSSLSYRFPFDNWEKLFTDYC